MNGRSGVARKALVLILMLFCAFEVADSQSAPITLSNLAPTPPMGWASWNHFFCDYTDETIRAQADALVSTGMRELGYKYVLIQECIAPGRDPQGGLVIDAKRFPHGMKSLVDYIHSLGLKAGIYTDVGQYTCYPEPRYQGSYQHEEQDAGTFALWGMDFVEMDYCNIPAEHTGRDVYERMATAIQKTGRPMMFYICSWGNESPWTWAYGKAQLWRTEYDISSDKDHVEWGKVVRNFETNGRHSVFSAPNSWNDPDMMEIGNAGLNLEEARTHFSMWAISAAPLWAGNDLSHEADAIRGIYTNPEVIAVDQDPFGAGAVRVGAAHADLEVWSKPLGSLTSGADAVMLLNLSAVPADIAVEWTDLGLSGKASVRDLWAHKDLGVFAGGYHARVVPHGSVLLKVTGEFSWTRGARYEAEWPGNLRGGGAELRGCHECNEEYAVSLRGVSSGFGASSLEFRQIEAPGSGTYRMTIAYVLTGTGDKTIQVRVNGGGPIDVKLQEHAGGRAVIAIALKHGDNSIVCNFKGEGSVDIDRIELNR